MILLYCIAPGYGARYTTQELKETIEWFHQNQSACSREPATKAAYQFAVWYMSSFPATGAASGLIHCPHFLGSG